MKKSSITSIATALVLVSIIVLTIPSYAVKPTPPIVDVPTLDPKLIPKFVNQLVKPPVYAKTTIAGVDYYTVNMTKFMQQILPPPLPETEVWGYGGIVDYNPLTGLYNDYFRFAPGATFEAMRGTPINVTWQNFITSSHMFAVDPTLHWADPNNIGMMVPPPFPSYPPGFDGTSYTYPNGTLAPSAQYPVPLIPHLHGGEVHSTSDGHPEAWFTSTGIKGPEFYASVGTENPNEARFYYPNAQPPTTLWYHDHALGITRINVMSGLAGFYLLRDPVDTTPLPFGNYEYPIVIQDRSFNIGGSMWFPKIGIDPNVHPYWQPEFFGNTIMVNGKVWPNLNVEQALYRFRLLDGSNARFYDLWFQVKPLNPLLNPPPLTFWQIGTDGGYLPAPVPLTRLTIAPGERADIIVDFSALSPGDRVIVRNRASAPFPNGASPDPKTVGTIMQFTVTGPLSDNSQPIIVPTTLPHEIAALGLPDNTRTLTLIEKMGPLGPTEIFLDGQKWAGNPLQAVSENVTVGSIEDWIIVNPTADTHPIHLHLVQFQLVSRQKFNVNKYHADWMMANVNNDPNIDPLPFDHPTVNIALAPYLMGNPAPPAPNEMGWKDTIQTNPGEVTIIRVRFAPLEVGLPGEPPYIPGVNQYLTLIGFDPTTGPGYVWHCHILDHEDNEMMRPYLVKNPPP
jgi:spore coat protein A